jgi:hypothetical protein
MNSAKRRLYARRIRFIRVLMAASLGMLAGHFYLYGQDKSEFPDGYDAVQAAPDSHTVIFENTWVRVLEVTVPPPGNTIPMHHHRWPSFFLDWDTGGYPAYWLSPCGWQRSGAGQHNRASSCRGLERSVDEAGTNARHRGGGQT